MKSSQWIALGIILFIGGVYLLSYGSYSLFVQTDVGYIRAGIYGAFGQTLMILGIAFGILALLERSKKR